MSSGRSIGAAFELHELTAQGYSVGALGGSKWWRGSYGRFKAGPVGQLAVLVTGPLTRPDHAFALLGIKHLTPHRDPHAVEVVKAAGRQLRHTQLEDISRIAACVSYS
jgi:hypothetical protein